MGPRFKAAKRSILDNIGEGLMWIGLTWGGMCPPPDTYAPPSPAPDPGPLPVSLPPDEEWAEWAALVKRLQ